MMNASAGKRPIVEHPLVHILIVDDIQTNLRLAKAFLNGGGYQNVVTVHRDCVDNNNSCGIG